MAFLSKSVKVKRAYNKCAARFIYKTDNNNAPSYIAEKCMQAGKFLQRKSNYAVTF